MPLPGCLTLSLSVRACFPARQEAAASSPVTESSGRRGDWSPLCRSAGTARAERLRGTRRAIPEALLCPLAPLSRRGGREGAASVGAAEGLRSRADRDAQGVQKAGHGSCGPSGCPGHREGRSEPGLCTNTDVTGGRRPKRACQSTWDAAGTHAVASCGSAGATRSSVPLTCPGPSRGSGRWRGEVAPLTGTEDRGFAPEGSGPWLLVPY